MMNFFSWTAALATALLSAAAIAAEPSFPFKPLRLITVLPVGADIYVRALGTKFSEIFGQPVITENRPGASGVLAVQSVLSAPADGHVLLIHSPAFFISKSTQPSLAFDPMADFAAVAQIYGGGLSFLVVRGDSPITSIEALIARARTAPGKISYGSTGAGLTAHLSAESFLQIAQIQALHIPYKSTADYMQALVRGDTDFSVALGTSAMPLIRSGRLRALGVTSAARSRDLPDVPTLRELLKSELLVQEFWAGLAAPAKTPPEAVRVLHAATVKALGDPAVRKSIESTGNVPATGESPEEFAAYMRRENDKWREIVKRTGLRAD
jgi:tripartite-type tricarboxylate transporter receptor subunit TctC